MKELFRSADGKYVYRQDNDKVLFINTPSTPQIIVTDKAFKRTYLVLLYEIRRLKDEIEVLNLTIDDLLEVKWV